jgi:hypothetical protein
MSQIGLRRRARSPELAEALVARMLEAHDYRPSGPGSRRLSR